MKYFISKNKYKGDIVYLDIDRQGYKISPKDNLQYDGIKVNQMVIIKPDFIEKVIKRKIKNRLNLYLNFLVDDSSDDDTRKALGDIQRYRLFVNEKYIKFLDSKYMKLLNNKIDILERNLKRKIIVNLNQPFVNSYAYEERENHRKR